MKVLLVYPRAALYNPFRVAWIPLSLSFIASMLRKEGHVVSIFDRASIWARKRDRERLNEVMMEGIRRFQPDLIGLNTLSPVIHDTAECVRLIRSIYAGPMVAGGHHATALPELTLLRIPGLDGVVEGEGEIAMAKLADGADPVTVPGVWWKGKEGPVTRPPSSQIETLDSLPFPALDLLDMAFYMKPSLSYIRGYYLATVPVLTARGCVYRCDFCSESLPYGKGIRFHSPEYVLEWIKKLVVDYRGEGIYFYDNDFLADENRAKEICERILSAGLSKKIKWGIQTRANRIRGEILRLLKKAGCVVIEIGVESASKNHLDSVHKKITVEMNELAIRLCKKEGIRVHAFMLTGFEGEKVSDLQQGLQWLREARPDSFSWFPLMIHPGTALYRRSGNSFFEKSDWTEMNIINYYQTDFLSSIPAEEREKWMDRHLLPYQKWRNRLNFLKANLPRKLVPLVVWKVKEEGVRLFRD